MLIHWLCAKAPTDDGPPPEWPASVGSIPNLPAEDDAPEAMPDPVDLGQFYTAIEYENANGERSLRRITLIRLSTGPRGPIVSAFCHERGALRTFRGDRITYFIDPDGVVATPAEFFQATGIELSDYRVGSVRKDMSFKLASPMAILLTAAKSDGSVHPEEIDKILLYAERELFALGESPSLEKLDQIAVRLKRMRPTRSSMEWHLRAVMKFPDAAFKRFIDALEGVVVADGRVAEEEIGLLDELSLARTRILREPNRRGIAPIDDDPFG